MFEAIMHMSKALSPALVAAVAVLPMASQPVWAQAGGQPSKGAAAADTSSVRTPAPKDAYVYIGWPLNGAVVGPTHIKVWFGTRNFGVAPAGVNRANTGHHHLLIDVPVPPFDQPIPNDANHLHFGLGQTETFIDLPPGRHTLQLLMGDADHVPHNPPVVSQQITITVRGGR